jgi:hypothetical protein
MASPGVPKVGGPVKLGVAIVWVVGIMGRKSG